SVMATNPKNTSLRYYICYTIRIYTQRKSNKSSHGILELKESYISMKTEVNYTSWKSVTLAVTAFLLMTGVASAGPTPTRADNFILIDADLATHAPDQTIGPLTVTG